MATGDLFKRSLEAGTSFLDMTRERAEAMVKEWVDAGDLGKGRAQKAVEQVLDRSRKASDELRAMVRKEIGVQLAALGVATRDDIARLEAKIDAARASSGPVRKVAAKKVTANTVAAERPAKATTAKRPAKATTAKATTAKATTAKATTAKATTAKATTAKATTAKKAPAKKVSAPKAVKASGAGSRGTGPGGGPSPRPGGPDAMSGA